VCAFRVGYKEKKRGDRGNARTAPVKQKGMARGGRRQDLLQSEKKRARWLSVRVKVYRPWSYLGYVFWGPSSIGATCSERLGESGGGKKNVG